MFGPGPSKLRKMAREARRDQVMVTVPQWQKISKTNKNQFMESGMLAAAVPLYAPSPLSPPVPSSQYAQPLSDL